MIPPRSHFYDRKLIPDKLNRFFPLKQNKYSDLKKNNILTFAILFSSLGSYRRNFIEKLYKRSFNLDLLDEKYFYKSK